MEGKQPPHIAILPTPGMGHLIPQFELAKSLVCHHNLSVTVVVVSINASSKSLQAVVDALPKAINIKLLPPIPSTAFPKDSTTEAQFSLAIHHSLPSLRDIFKASLRTNPVVALVVDVFGVGAFDVAREFGVSPYLFNLSSMAGLSFALYFPFVSEQLTCDPKDLKEPLKVPGCPPLHGKDVPDPVKDRSKDSYALCLQIGRRMKEADGILINSFMELEPEAARVLKEDRTTPPIYPIGPLVETGSPSNREEVECLRWLEKQPHGSVLFICFGSGGTLSQDQMTELAWGLEMSGHRFLWVVRPPDEKKANAAYLSSKTGEDCSDFLPRGFVARTQAMGLVVPSWAPQQRVLSHGSTGGFLSHCGWSSTLDSIVNGVAMIAWPLYAEQNLNAVMLAENLKVAIRPKAGHGGLVERHEIANIIKRLMGGEDGKRLKKRIQELKQASSVALEKDGSSHSAMSKVAEAWKILKPWPS